jgi:hypothetical protein
MAGGGMAMFQVLGAAGQFASGIMSAGARRAEFDEQIRQLGNKRDFTLSLTKARAAASGITADSRSTGAYLRGLTTEFNYELGLLAKARKTAYAADILGATFGAMGGGASAAGSYSKMNPAVPGSPVSDGAEYFASRPGWKPGGV